MPMPNCDMCGYTLNNVSSWSKHITSTHGESSDLPGSWWAVLEKDSRQSFSRMCLMIPANSLIMYKCKQHKHFNRRRKTICKMKFVILTNIDFVEDFFSKLNHFSVEYKDLSRCKNTRLTWEAECNTLYPYTQLTTVKCNIMYSVA